MVEIYNSELLENAGLVAVCDEDSVTIFTIEELTNGFKEGDIIVKKEEELLDGCDCIMCRYCEYDGKALKTDAFYIRRTYGSVEKGKRPYPMGGLGFTTDYRLATEKEKEFFNSEIVNAEYVNY